MVPRYTTYAEMYRVIVDSMRSRTRLDLPKLDSVWAIFFSAPERFATTKGNGNGNGNGSAMCSLVAST